MSEVHTLHIGVHGAGGHAAMPGAGDVVKAVAALAVELSTVVDGMSLEGSDCVCTPACSGRHRAERGAPLGTAPRHAAHLHRRSARRALGRLELLCARIGADYEVDVHLELAGHAPAVVNDPITTAVVADAARAMLDDTVADGRCSICRR